MGVTARLLKQELLIHVDYGLPFGDIVVRYRGPISDPDALPEQVIHLLRSGIPRDVQFELDELYQGFTRKIPPPSGPARVGWVIQPALATILIQDHERPTGLAVAWLTYVQHVPATGPRLEQQHSRSARWTSPRRSAPRWSGSGTASRGSPGRTTRGRSASERAAPGDPARRPPAARARWIGEAAAAVKSATAMALATVDGDGRPTVRMVICRGFDAVAGRARLLHRPRERQGGGARADPARGGGVPLGRVRAADPGRGPGHPGVGGGLGPLLGHASARRAARRGRERAEPPDRLARGVPRADRGGAARARESVPRPPRWGGYRIWAERVELWAGQPGRAHDRAAWTRAVPAHRTGFTGGAWVGTRLQP